MTIAHALGFAMEVFGLDTLDGDPQHHAPPDPS